MTRTAALLSAASSLALALPVLAQGPIALDHQALATTSNGVARGATNARGVQITAVDFEDQIVEVTNLTATDIDLTGWRFCSHDFNQARQYTGASGLNGVSLPSGGVLFVHFNNDAPAGDPLRVNRSALGAFATPLAPTAYGMQFFFPASNGSVSFANSDLIADHLQWNIAGDSVGTAETRTQQAVNETLWSAVGDFIPTTTGTLRIELTDLSGGISNEPADYATTEPNPCPADVAAPLGTLDVFDILGFLQLWNTNDPIADFDQNSQINVFDILTFLGEWNAGCP